MESLTIFSYLIYISASLQLIFAKPEEKFKSEETCINKFCPHGTYCEAHNVVKCRTPPCRPILLCLPENFNGCANLTCNSGTTCVERTVPCINKICKKTARCVKPGTCDALVCPPSHRCVSDPNPHCVRGIFTISEVAQLSQHASEGQ